MKILNKLTKSVMILNGSFLKYANKNQFFSFAQRKLSLGVNQHKIRRDGLKVVFFGSDFFSVRILRALKNLVAENITDISVVTSSKTNRSKDSQVNIINQDVIDICHELKINYHIWSQISIDDEYLKLLKDFDVGVLASFGHLIPAKLINLFP